MNTEAARLAPSYRRWLLGLGGLISLLIGLALPWWTNDAALNEFARGSLLKIGLVLLAAWLALPQIDRLPNWIFSVLLGLLFLLALRPRVVPILLRLLSLLLPIFAAIWLLRRVSQATERRH